MDDFEKRRLMAAADGTTTHPINHVIEWLRRPREPKPAFHPMRFVDVLIENLTNSIALIGLFFVGLWVSGELYAIHGSSIVWLVTAVIFAFIIPVMFTPQATIYGRPIGVWWSGWAYRRIRSKLR